MVRYFDMMALMVLYKRLLMVAGMTGGVAVCSLLACLALMDRCSARTQPAQVWEGVPAVSWMAWIDPALPLSEVSLAGSHNSGAVYVDKVYELFARCQEETIRGQLEAGVRFLDIRLCQGEDGSPRVCHGEADCFDGPMDGERERSYLSFAAALEEVYDFLARFPTEAVVMSVKADRRMPGLDSLLSGVIEAAPVNPATGSPFWYRGSSVPRMGECRGRIVLLRRFGAGKGVQPLGLDFTGWGDNESFVLRGPELTAHVQDRYLLPAQLKWPVVKRFLRGAHEFSGGEVVLNFASANAGPLGPPRAMARDINRRLESQPWSYGVRYGWVVVDFADARLSRLVFSSNKKAEAPASMESPR